MSSREIGTLIVVVLRAKNLPNKRHIGKQDPYCSIRFNTETRRTKAVKRGGQHPEWDEEIRFQIYQDVEDEPVKATDGDQTPPKERFRNIKGGKSMRLCCYADDPRDPDLIGETQVDLTEALTKGEVDEWFTLNSKDKYAGEVYLEMTFWSKQKPPAKKKAPRPSTNNPQYGGPGSFTPSGSTNEIPAALRPNRESSPQGQPGDRRSGVPESLRPSSSALGDLNLYIPPYNSQTSLASHNSLPTAVEPTRASYDEFGMTGPDHGSRRRDSFPLMRQDPPASLYGHQPQPSSASISSHNSYQQSQPFDPYPASSIAQSMSNMHIGQPPPSLYPPATPAPGFNPPNQFGYSGPPSNIPPPFLQGPGYQPTYGPPGPTSYPPNGHYQPGFPPAQTPLPPQNGNNQTVRIVSSGFAPPQPIPTPMPFNAPPGPTPFQQPPNQPHTPFPQQHPYPAQQYQPPPQGPPAQNGPPNFSQPGPYPQQPATFSPPPQQQPQSQPFPQSNSPPRGALPPVPQNQPPLPPPQQFHPPQQFPPQNFPPPPTPLQQHSSSGSRPLPTPQSSSNSIPSAQGQRFDPQPPGAFPPPVPNGQQWHPHGRSNSFPSVPTPLPGPPPPLPQPRNSPPRQNMHTQSPPPNGGLFQAPPPPPPSSAPPATSFQTQYQNNAEHQLPPPPSAYQQPPPHPQQQRQSVPIGGIFPGPSTTSIYPGPPPKPPQMIQPEHSGWQ